MSALRPLLSTNHLIEIPISDNPPRLGGTIRKITPEEFKEKFGCEFTEAIWGNKKDVKAALNDWQSGGKQMIASPSFTAKVLDRLEHPFTDIVISKISDAVGYGLFATEEIPRNTVIALYSGQIHPHIPPDDSYAFGINLDFNSEEQLTVSSLKRGGIARFLQHLPKDGEKLRKDILSRFLDVDYHCKKLVKAGAPLLSQIVAMRITQNKPQFERWAEEEAASEYDSELDDLVFSNSSGRSQIAVRNVRIKKRIVNGKPLLVLITLYPIKQGDQLGLSYREVVSVNVRRFPEFFDLKGNVVPHTSYKRKWIQLSFKSQIPGKIFLTPRFEITSITNIQSIVSRMPHLSPYQIRRYLIRANVIGVERLLPIQPTTFALNLIELLSQQSIEASVQTFFRSNQLNANKPETYIVDVVCKLKGSNKPRNQNNLEKLLSPIISHIKAYRASYEIIFEETNVTPSVFQDFIRSIMSRK